LCENAELEVEVSRPRLEIDFESPKFLYEKSNQSILLAISQERSDQFQNPSVVQILDMKTITVPNLKLIGLFL